MSDIKKVVLAYSGGLDTSVILKWLIETYGCEVVAFSADIGQEEELDFIEPKALKTGATKVYVDDLTEEFVKDYVFPAFRANAIYENQYLLGTSLAVPSSPSGRWRSQSSKAAMPSAMAPPEKATTRSVSSSATTPSIPTSRSSPPGGTGISIPVRPSWILRKSTTSRFRPPGRSPTAPTGTSSTSATKGACWKTRGTKPPTTCTP